MQYLLLFISGFIIDIIWTLYIKSIANDKYSLGAIYSAGTGLCNLFMIHEFTKDIMNGLPYIAGLFFGTYFSKYLVRK